MDKLFELLSRLFENNNVAGIIISACLLLSLLGNIGFFLFTKKVLKYFSDLFYSLYWNHQRKLLNKPITEKQKKLQKEIELFLLKNNFSIDPNNKSYFYIENLPGLNEPVSITIGKTHSFLCSAKNKIITPTGWLDNQNIDNRCLLQLLNDLMEKGSNGLNRADYHIQQEEIKEPNICKKCKFFICSGWNY